MGFPVTVSIWGENEFGFTDIEVYGGNSTFLGLYHFLKLYFKGEKRPIKIKVCRL